MGRGKLTLDLIEKEKARMITYQKRKKGLNKKAEELATLCGVPMTMIIYGPRLNNRPADVEIWPKDHKEFMEVVNLYRDKAFSYIRGVKSQNLSDFLVDRNRKVYEKISKTRKANYELKFSCDMEEEEINVLSLQQLKDMIMVLDNNIDVATRKLSLIKGHHQISSNNNVNFPLDHPPPPPPPPYPHHYHNEALQMVPFGFSPVDNPMMAMMMMNGGDQTLQMGSGAHYNHPPPMQHGMYYDVMGAMIENHHAVTMNHQFPAAHPSISSQVYGSQFNGVFYEDYINQFHHRR